MKPAFQPVPRLVFQWWEATKELGRVRVTILNLQKMALMVPPDIVTDHDNALRRVAALKASGADKAADKYCKENHTVALMPFLGSGRVHPEDERLLKKGADRAFHGYRKPTN